MKETVKREVEGRTYILIAVEASAGKACDMCPGSSENTYCPHLCLALGYDCFKPVDTDGMHFTWKEQE